MPTDLPSGPHAVVFDLDGALVDSVPDIAAALNAAVVAAGFTPLTVAEVACMVGNGSEMLVARALTALTSEAASAEHLHAIHARFLAAYDAAPCVASRLYPDALAILDHLAARGVTLGICTNKPQTITHSALRHLGIAERFASVVGGNAGDRLKPALDMVRRTLRELGAAPAHAVFVGDSAADAGAARAAGTRLVLLEHGYTRDDLHSLGADAVLAGFADLPDALARMTFAGA